MHIHIDKAAAEQARRSHDLGLPVGTYGMQQLLAMERQEAEDKGEGDEEQIVILKETLDEGRRLLNSREDFAMLEAAHTAMGTFLDTVLNEGEEGMTVLNEKGMGRFQSLLDDIGCAMDRVEALLVEVSDALDYNA